MVNVTFRNSLGDMQRKGRVGDSLMDLAVTSDVPGIEATCGGSAVCGTCHVYVDQDWLPHLEAPLATETDLLDALEHVRSNSRLSCQIRLGDHLDGLSVEIPIEQS